MVKPSKRMIPKETMLKIIKKAGAYRVSDKAADELAFYCYAYAFRVASLAVQAAESEGYVTVKLKHIELAGKFQ